MVRRSKQANLYEHILKEIPLLDDDSLMALSALSRQLVIARGQAKAKLLNLQSPVKMVDELMTKGSATIELPVLKTPVQVIGVDVGSKEGDKTSIVKGHYERDTLIVDSIETKEDKDEEQPEG